MNIVKGVASFLRKNSSVSLGNSPTGPQDEGLSTPLWPDIQFSDAGNEANLESKWEKYEAATIKEEKEKALEEFLSLFLQIFEEWRPLDMPNELSVSPHVYSFHDPVKGCSFGHPTRVILVLTQEMKAITEHITQWQSFPDLAEVSPNPSRIESGLKLLDALCLLTRSEHNQNIFCYYGGFQMLVALMKVAVLRLKELASEITVDQSPPYSLSVQFSFLKCLLAHVVSVASNFIGTHFKDGKKVDNSDTSSEYFLKDGEYTSHTSESRTLRLRSPLGSHDQSLPLMETGGLNWFVELLRLLQGLRSKNYSSETPLEVLTLKTLKAALVLNPRAQNHFKTIGGIVVLLDGIEYQDWKLHEKFPPLSDHYDPSFVKKCFEEFDLQIQYLEVLREAVYGNTNCLLSVFDSGGIERLCWMIRWAAFVLPSFGSHDSHVQCDQNWGKPAGSLDIEKKNQVEEEFLDGFSLQCENPTTSSSSQNLQGWNAYVAQLSRILWSFLLPKGDFQSLSSRLSCDQVGFISSSYLELAMKWMIRVFISVFTGNNFTYNLEDMIPDSRFSSSTLQHYILYVFRKFLTASPTALKIIREEKVWDMLFSKYFFYFKSNFAEQSQTTCNFGQEYKGISMDRHIPDQFNNLSSLSTEDGPMMQTETIQIEVIAVVELAATANGNFDNTVECSALLSALWTCIRHPQVVTLLAKSLHRILQLASETTITSFKKLNAISELSNIINSMVPMLLEATDTRKSSTIEVAENTEEPKECRSASCDKTADQCMEAIVSLLAEYMSTSDDIKHLALCNITFVESLFNMLWTGCSRKFALKHILDLIKLPPSSENEKEAKLGLCLKYFEMFHHTKESPFNNRKSLSTEMLAGVREILRTDTMYYQTLFCDGECFLHILTLLNGSSEDEIGETFCLDVIKTLTDLLSGNMASKVIFRSLVGQGYKMLERLLLDCCKGKPTLDILNALIDMLVDGSSYCQPNKLIENEDVIMLFFNILRQGDETTKCHGLQMFCSLLEGSTANGAACVRTGLLSLLLDWYGLEETESLILWIGKLIKLIGGHSITGKDMRKIFALLRTTQDGIKPRHSSGLLNILQSILKEGGPSVFFDLNGRDSGIILTSPVCWPCSRGFTFSCWIRIERFPQSSETMGLFSFLTESGKGCTVSFNEEGIVVQAISSKKQYVYLTRRLPSKQWFFFCITHSTGRAFSGGNSLKCYVDASLVGSEKLRYPKVMEPLTQCTIGARVPLDAVSEHENEDFSSKLSIPFCGQLGPVYFFDDALSSEQIFGIFSLGPSYMYSFLDTDIELPQVNNNTCNILDPKEGLASKIVFGFNAQASASRNLFDISPLLDHSKDQKDHKARIMAGTQLCSRSVVRDILDCVGGVCVLFPLLTQLDQPQFQVLHFSKEELSSNFVSGEDVAAQVIELIAAVLDGNSTNQEVMHKVSGFAILGFLLQSVSPQNLTQKVVAALGQLLTVVEKSDLKVSEILAENILNKIYLNPHIWIYTKFAVQRELYMFLLNHFDSYNKIICHLCRLPRILDIICQFYWDWPKGRQAFGSKPLLHPLTRETIGERPTPEEIGKIRLLLLSLSEMVLRQGVRKSDVNSLVAFLEKNDDLKCIEDVLHMILRLLDHKPFLTSFLEHVLTFGGCHIFLNVLRRTSEIIRLQTLQVLGRLLLAMPAEKKGIWPFPLAVGITKGNFELQNNEKMKLEAMFSVMADRLLSFPFTDGMHATIFDILLGGASPKQVLQRIQNPDQQLDKRSSAKLSSSHFALPQMLSLLFRFMKSCEDSTTREHILGDLQKLLEASYSNIECLISEYGWQIWFLSLLSDPTLEKDNSSGLNSLETNEALLIRSIFCVVHFHCICTIKGGWHHVDQTISFIFLHLKQRELRRELFVHDIMKDLIQGLLHVATDQEFLTTPPCRDNTWYILTIIDEILINDTVSFLQFPRQELLDALEKDNTPDEGFNTRLSETSGTEQVQRGHLCVNFGTSARMLPSTNQSRGWQESSSEVEETLNDQWWELYDKVWMLISEMNGKGGRKKTLNSTSSFPSLSQRARDLVESLNVPAVGMAAAVVTGGLGAVVNMSTSILADKAIRLRGEKFPRILNRLLLLYLYKADLERASRCVQQFTALLPYVFSTDTEQIKNRLQLFIWSLLDARTHVGSRDNGARFHVISQLIRETVKHGKAMLATSIADRDNFDDADETSSECGSVNSLLHKEKILMAARDEANYIRSIIADRQKQIIDIQTGLGEISSQECEMKKILEDEIQSNLGTVCSSEANRRLVSRLAYDEEQQLITEKWCHIFRDLTDERGAWSPISFPNNSITRWKLDRTEDPWRRRIKLKRNYYFDEQLCHPPSTNASESESQSNSEDTHSNLKNLGLGEVRSFLLKGLRGISEEEVPESFGDEENISNSELSSSEIKNASEGVEQIENMEDAGDNDKVHDKQEQTCKLSETGDDEVLLSVSCVLVTAKWKLAGHLDVMKMYLHFYGEFLVEGTGGSRVFNSSAGLNYPSLETSNLERSTKHSCKSLLRCDGESDKGNAMERFDPVQQKHVASKKIKDVKRHRRWEISKVKAVHLMRYLLQYTAIEIFFSNSAPPVFINFASERTAKEVGKQIVLLRNEALFPKGGLKNRDEIIHLIDKRFAIELAERAREMWRRRDISNFEYLMILNTLAGRSYNDLTQYPVFPWILSDYTSSTLDLNKSSTFRDLSKPVGALDMKRLEVFEERYHNFSDPDIPSFYYGSHYSSMGCVLFYLLRLEPFTTLHRGLQGGKFDHADRLFHSIEGAFANCLSNTSDVKELIPEFFYMPEFLVNSNKYHLGIKQDGEPLGDVVLPPWAKNSPEEFIYKHREALESEHVSSNLHHWIDLIFGYKQRGKAAIEAANVFYYLTYEGAVDLEAIDDPMQRAAIEDQIGNFGQTPIQLFKKKHPKRGPPMPIARPLYYAPASIKLTSVVSAGFDNANAIIFVGSMDSTVVLVSRDLVIAVKMWLTSQIQSGGNLTFSSSQDPFFAIGSDLITPRKIAGPLAENIDFINHCFSILQVQSSNFLVCCGNWDNSFRVVSLHDGRMVQSIRQHKDLVSCVSVAKDGSVVVTGSYDTTVMVWEVAASSRINKKSRDLQSFQDRMRKDQIFPDKPLHILYGHDDVVTCVAVSVELDLVVSASKDSTCILYSLRKGRYVRSIQYPSCSPLAKIVLSQHGRLVLYSNEDLNLYLYSINGKHLATSESNGRVNSMVLSSCGEFLVCSGDKGQIVLRSMHSLEVLYRYDAIGKGVSSLSVTPEDCFLAGTQDGYLLLYSIETPQQHRVNLQNVKLRTFSTC